MERALLAKAKELVTSMEIGFEQDQALVNELNELRAFKDEVIRVVTDDANTMQGIGRYVLGIVNTKFRGAGK